MSSTNSTPSYNYDLYISLINKGWYGMFVACGIWCLADVSSVNPSSEQRRTISTFVDHTHIQRTRPRRKTVFFKTSLPVFIITTCLECLVYKKYARSAGNSTLSRIYSDGCVRLPTEEVSIFNFAATRSIPPKYDPSCIYIFKMPYKCLQHSRCVCGVFLGKLGKPLCMLFEDWNLFG